MLSPFYHKLEEVAGYTVNGAWMREVNSGNVLGVQGCLHLNGLSPRSSTIQDQLT